MKGLIATDLANVTSLHAEIDGVTVKKPVISTRRSPGFFSMGKAQPGSLLESLGRAGGYADLHDDFRRRSWLMIEGLTPGEHTLTFGGTQAAFTFNGPENTYGRLHDIRGRTSIKVV